MPFDSTGVACNRDCVYVSLNDGIVLTNLSRPSQWEIMDARAEAFHPGGGQHVA
jgi:hypothetical protein